MKIRPLHDRVIVKRVTPKHVQPAVFISLKQPVKNLTRVLSSLSVPASVTKQASSSLWMLK